MAESDPDPAPAPTPEGSPWLAGATRRFPPLTGPVETTVAIVGAGLTGLFAARALVAERIAVVVMDEGLIASGASGRSSGVIFTGTGEPVTRLLLYHDPPIARAILEMTRQSQDLVASAVAADRIDCDLAQPGGHRFALSPREFQELERSQELLAQVGFEARVMDRSRAQEVSGSPVFHGGLHLPGDLVLDPGKLASGLASALADRGVPIHEETPVIRLAERPDGSFGLLTATGKVSAQFVILATGAAAPRLLPELAEKVVAFRSQSFLLEPLEPPFPRVPGVANFGNELWVGTPDGRLLMTGARETSTKTEITTDDRSTSRVQGALERFMGTVFPALKGWPVARRWAGVVAKSCDEVPIVGPVPGRHQLLVATGLGDFGLSLAPAVGQRLAQVILTGRYQDQEVLGLRRFVW